MVVPSLWQCICIFRVVNPLGVSEIQIHGHFFYTTNPTKHSRSESDLESSVESHRALAKQWPSKSVERSASAQWDSTGDSKSLSLVKRSLAAAEHSVAAAKRSVVYRWASRGTCRCLKVSTGIFPTQQKKELMVESMFQVCTHCIPYTVRSVSLRDIIKICGGGGDGLHMCTQKLTIHFKRHKHHNFI